MSKLSFFLKECIVASNWNLGMITTDEALNVLYPDFNEETEL